MMSDNWRNILLIGKRIREFSGIYHGKDLWRAKVRNQTEANGVEFGAGMVERCASRLAELLPEVRNLAISTGAEDPLVAETHVLVIRVQERFGWLFFAAFSREFGIDDPVKSADALARRIEKVIGPEIETIDRLWPLLIAKSDLELAKVQDIPDDVDPDLLAAARVVLAEIDRDSTQAVVKAKMRKNGVVFKDQRMGPVFKFLASTGEYNGQTRKANAQT